MPIPSPNLTYKVQPVSFPDIQHCIGWKGGTAKHFITNSTALGRYSETNCMNVPGSLCPGLSELLVVCVLYFSTFSQHRGHKQLNVRDFDDLKHSVISYLHSHSQKWLVRTQSPMSKSRVSGQTINQQSAKNGRYHV